MDGRFQDRQDAGRQLARHLTTYAGQADVLVLGLPRGGVPVAQEVARKLDAPMDIFVVRKLGVPGQEELAMGAIASGGVRIVNQQVVQMLGLTQNQIAAVAADEQRELERRDREYRGGRSAPQIEGKTIILVDDGLATGSTMRAAATAVRSQGPKWLVVAVPVGAPETCDTMRGEVDEVVCAITPEPFYSVGAWYDDFSQTTDQEVRELVGRPCTPMLGAEAPHSHTGGSERRTRRTQAPEQTVRVDIDRIQLEGNLTVPPEVRGVVLFAHGSGSGRHSPRNRFVARELNEVGLATLLVDLLTTEEERIDLSTRHLRFDIGLLAERLVHATDWLWSHPDTRALPIGYFGASTGGGAALVAAAERPHVVGAVVSRGGRPDLAGDALPHVRAPTLLIVGGDDVPVIGMNEEARARMAGAEVRLEIVPGATHLFEEPGKLEEVSRLAGEWFLRHLGHSPAEHSNFGTPTRRK